MVILSKQINWKKVLIRCHALGDILTPAKDAKVKAEGGMGQTAIKRLIKVYAFEKWGREENISTDQILKGIMQEGIGIKLINTLEKEKFVKNDERLENNFFSGVPDFFKGKELRKAKLLGDNKCAYTAESFLLNEIAELKKIYDWQMTGYGSLSGCPKAAVYFTLVNAPDLIIQKQLNKLRYDMGVIDESVNIEYQQAAAELQFNRTFDDIPEKERLIKIEVDIDNEKVIQAEAAVIKSREWLANFDETRMSRYAN